MLVGETPLDLEKRADDVRIFQDSRLIASAEVDAQILDAMPCMVLILNKERQVVFANARLLERLEVSSGTDVLGKRPGELLNCIRASDAMCGCGAGEFCNRCGAARAILHSQIIGQTVVNECRIMTVDGGAYEFKVWASPYSISDVDFTIFCLEDIGNQKRREALEKVFFHDLNKALGVVVDCADLFDVHAHPDELPELVGTIRSAIDGIYDEILGHKAMLAAENGELSITLSSFDSLLLLKEIQRLGAGGETRQAPRITLAPACEEFSIVTDRTLLRRVLGNMVKNAIEAAEEGGEVQLACKKRDSLAIFSVHGTNYMPVSIQGGVFLRSFTTKGKGRGLGTYSMKLFGETYLEGKVWFESTASEGTTFCISLPLSRLSTS